MNETEPKLLSQDMLESMKLSLRYEGEERRYEDGESISLRRSKVRRERRYA
jgi:hypothetical protein